MTTQNRNEYQREWQLQQRAKRKESWQAWLDTPADCPHCKRPLLLNLDGRRQKYCVQTYTTFMKPSRKKPCAGFTLEYGE